MSSNGEQAGGAAGGAMKPGVPGTDAAAPGGADHNPPGDARKAGGGVIGVGGGRNVAANAQWGGRFAAGPAVVMAEINASVGFDHRHRS